ncbi:MAG: 3-phosphoshikimate 1-carboxyvinyltransferase [Candidatus Hydrogenedentota bacterium]
MTTLPQTVSIEPRRNLDCAIDIPGSKSCTARALVMAMLTHGRSILYRTAECDDTDCMVAGIRGLGIPVDHKPETISVDGGELRPPSAPLHLGNSGTAVRFLTAACAALNGTAVLDGVQRMRERPIGDLVEALRHWGVEAEAPTGCPPVTVRSGGRFGGQTRIRGNASSQYLTGLLLAAPRATETAEIAVEGELVSKPYIDLTLAMMRERGVEPQQDGYQRFTIRQEAHYAPGAYTIEADASGASYFLAAAAIAGGRVRVNNLTTASHQGDAQFARILEAMGCALEEGDGWMAVTGGDVLRGIDADLNAMPDMAQTLAVTALFADGPTVVRNVGNLRIKECDRLTATATELRKLGAEVEEFEDGLRITPREWRAAAIDTYDDHRMAMSFAMAGLRIPGVTINNPACVSKTFPDFFERFNRLQ